MRRAMASDSITFRCGPLKKELEKEAKRQDVTLTSLLRQIARSYLEKKAGK